MSWKDMLFSEESKKSAKFYQKLLRLLDSPARKKYNNPDKLIENAKIEKGQVVLEIGCGSGFFTVEISKRVGTTGIVYATDIHPIAVRELKEKVKLLGLTNVVVQCEDALHTTFPEQSIDMIVLYGVVPAPVISLKDLAKEMHRILKPDGVCAIWTVAPFWRPTTIERYADFSRMKRIYPVFRLKKNSNISLQI